MQIFLIFLQWGSEALLYVSSDFASPSIAGQCHLLLVFYISRTSAKCAISSVLKRKNRLVLESKKHALEEIDFHNPDKPSE